MAKLGLAAAKDEHSDHLDSGNSNESGSGSRPSGRGVGSGMGSARNTRPIQGCATRYVATQTAPKAAPPITAVASASRSGVVASCFISPNATGGTPAANSPEQCGAAGGARVGGIPVLHPGVRARALEPRRTLADHCGVTGDCARDCRRSARAQLLRAPLPARNRCRAALPGGDGGARRAALPLERGRDRLWRATKTSAASRCTATR